ncbi:hypothetical protein MOX01_25330 [Microbacterium oxydans]|nr:hypothetical protein MOX01_25330 [Microbacterium oxydans]
MVPGGELVGADPDVRSGHEGCGDGKGKAADEAGGGEAQTVGTGVAGHEIS